MNPSEPLALERVLPSYGDRCITDVIPAVLAGTPSSFIDDRVAAARTVVLLVIDGLGWHQLRRYRNCAPTLADCSDGTEPITTVAPSTTAAALTSLSTGAAPGEHGLVSYRMPTAAGRLNALRWRAGGRDARATVPPEALQPVEPFCGQRVAVVSRTQFRHSGFTRAHLRGARFVGWAQVSDIVEAVRDAVDEGFALVYAYYDTLDKTAHEHGLGERYRGVLAEADRLTAALRAALAPQVPLLVTSDHGVVEVRAPAVMVDDDISALTAGSSGEARMLWLHARAGAAAELTAACGRYRPIAEVAPLGQVLDERWLGSHVTAAARSRLGDVALVPCGLTAFTTADEDRPGHALIGRHGGLSAEEMLVPFLQL